MEFGHQIRQIYERSRKPLAIILVILAVLLRVIPGLGTPAMLGALAASAVIIISMLFEIHKEVTERSINTVYPDFYEASMDMRAAISKAADRDNRLTLRWLGMSMGHAWPFLLNTLNPLMNGRRPIQTRVELAFLDFEWPELETINPQRIETAKANFESVNRFRQDHQPVLAEKGWSIDAWLYRHMPNYHGLLINERELFLSTCGWQEMKLSGAGNPYERFSTNDGFGKKKVELFQQWFEYSVRTATKKSKDLPIRQADRSDAN